mmetsp:Transcript_27993/g.47057  ORF Transcript_27993/g.47057 Transcript_27993/m.47057 type:complete len:191 (+) Transcript_27993:53-625(+)|eukprot:CAMPEP_0174979508 /NCGR_PEP_ID=MMETSP0004_2-20121128/14821_1 /TAXON_ID=420556 /ORGANISM="Ochromonas sp., Strain CCMP1393" /LENGTH=190 /DNA_ID=CAMNT_0016231045 /DNA_START=49 /DNA_END=621 /DNA_ORIENTATION=+
MNEDETIRKDKESFPNCNHSISSTQSCRMSEDGKFVCNALKNVYRNCPGERPRMIFSDEQKYDTSDPPNFGDVMKPFGNWNDLVGKPDQRFPTGREDLLGDLLGDIFSNSGIDFGPNLEDSKRSRKESNEQQQRSNSNVFKFRWGGRAPLDEAPAVEERQTGSNNGSSSAARSSGNHKPKGRIAGDSEDI